MSRRNRVVHRASVEVLERRRLLTFTVTGTPGPDLIEVFHDGLYRAQVNGFSAGFSTDSDVSIFGLDGNDRISILNVASGTSITVQGGLGDDTVTTGSGHLVVHLEGRIFVKEFAAEGNDLILIDDTVNNADTERNFTVGPSTLGGLTHRLSSGLLNPSNGVHFDANTESIQFFSGNAEDTVHVRQDMPPGLSMSLGGGNDQVIYGAIEQVVPFLPTATLDGGAGFDDLIFDDSERPALQRREYDAAEGFVMAQTVSGFENMTLETCPASNGNIIRFRGGFPVGDNITVRSPAGGFDHLEIGTQSQPIDLDDADLVLTEDARFCDIYDQDSNGSASPWEIWDDGAPSRQRVDKGGFRGRIEFPYVAIHGGSTNDVFEVSLVKPHVSMDVLGGGGNDSLRMANRNGHQSDLDAVFPFDDADPLRGRFTFGGESMYLDDSGDQMGDGDPNYYIGLQRPFVGSSSNLRSLTKGTAAPTSDTNGLLAFAVREIQLLGDADSNTFCFDLQAAELILHGGDGNDTFTNYNPNLNSGSLTGAAAGGALIGGPGTDVVTLEDSRDQLVEEYAFDAADGFAYRQGPTTWSFLIDSQMESVSVDENNRQTTTFLRSKRPSLALSISGRGGDDTFVVGGGDIDSSGFSAATTTLLGGTGEDRIEFDDRLDDHGVSDADTFTFAFQQVTKDGTSLIYSGFESQKLITSGVNTSPVLFPNTVRLHGIDMPTEIVGTAGDRDNTVEIGHPTFGVSQVTFGTITLSFAAAPAVVNVNDQVASAARAYQVTATQLLLPSVINYTGIAGFNIFAGSGNDSFNVDAVPAGTQVFFAGNNGNDLMSVGSGGPFGAVQGRVYSRGNAGDDELFFTNGLGGGFTDAILTNGTFTANGGPVHLYDTVETLHVAVNDSGSDIDVNSASAATTIHGAAGADQVTVGAGNINLNLAADLHIDGGGGVDQITFDDSAATSISQFISLGYTFDVLGANERLIRSADSATAPNRIISSNAVERRTLSGGISNSGVQVYNTSSALWINTQNGHDGIFVDETPASAPVTLYTGGGLDSLRVGNLPGPNTRPATVVFEQDDELRGMSVRDSGTLRIAAGATLSDLGIFSGSFGEPVISGVLDLAGGALLMRTGQFALTNDAIRGLITRGRNGGAWNGTNPSGLGAINSSRANESASSDGVGYGLGSQIAPTSIGSFAIGAGDTLVRYALDGDADLNAVVDIADFARAAANFNGTNKVWTSADSNYDNTTNIADFAALAANFNRSVSSPAPRPALGAFSSRVIGEVDHLAALIA